MTRKIIILALVTSVILLVQPRAWAENSDLPERRAQTELPAEVDKVCQALFRMLDQGKLKETYQLVAPMIKRIEKKDLWYGRMISERESMGDVKSRQLARVENVEKFADLPEGEYLMAVFRTEFSAHPQSMEIVVLTPVKDGEYGLAAYKIQYNRWPEAIKIITNGLFIVFLIMAMLATMTWIVGLIVQKTNKNKEKQKRKG